MGFGVEPPWWLRWLPRIAAHCGWMQILASSSRSSFISLRYGAAEGGKNPQVSGWCRVFCLWWVKCNECLQHFLFPAYLYQLRMMILSIRWRALRTLTAAWFVVLSHQASLYRNSWGERWRSWITLHSRKWWHACVKAREFHDKFPTLMHITTWYHWITKLQCTIDIIGSVGKYMEFGMM